MSLREHLLVEDSYDVHLRPRDPAEDDVPAVAIAPVPGLDLIADSTRRRRASEQTEALVKLGQVSVGLLGPPTLDSEATDLQEVAPGRPSNLEASQGGSARLAVEFRQEPLEAVVFCEAAHFTFFERCAHCRHPRFLFFEPAKARADDFARRGEPASSDLSANEGLEMTPETDAGVLGHRDSS